MPGGQERALKRRITSVKSTKKITRAMELIAATRVVKAMQRANEARPYASRITGVIEDLAAQGTGVEHPLLRQADDVRCVAYIAVTSDRGLAGPYNSAVIRATEREIMADQTEGREYRLVLHRQEGPGLLPVPQLRDRPHLRGHDRRPTYEHAREVADHRARHVRRRRGRPGRARLPGVRLHGYPAGGRASVPAARAPRCGRHRRWRRCHRQGRVRVRALARRVCCRRCCLATSSPVCSRRCSTRRRPNTPTGSGP